VICPDRERRAALDDDGEFWDEVLDVSLEFEGPLIESEDEIVEKLSLTGSSCVQCGATGPCAYDAEGRPLIHADSQEVGE